MSNERFEELHPPGDVKFHHIGFVLRSIQDNGDSLARSLCAIWDKTIVFDPLQKVRVTFLRGLHFADPMIELVEPAGSDSPVLSFLERGGGLHHLCYEVADLDSHLVFCQSVGTIILRRPVPAVAFGGRRIAWALTKRRLLVEFLESELCVSEVSAG